MKKLTLKIKKMVYESLVLDTPYAPPEIGGIIGGINGVATCCVNDLGTVSKNFNRYQPNVEKLNFVIADWISKEIDFMGIYHSHPLCDIELSQADYEYIEDIMKNISKYTDRLYFPLVIPKEKIISYCAVNVAGEINVFQTAIKII